MGKWTPWRLEAARVLRAYRNVKREATSADFKMRTMKSYYCDSYVRRLIANGTNLNHHFGNKDIPEEIVEAKRTELILRRIEREHKKCT